MGLHIKAISYVITKQSDEVRWEMETIMDLYDIHKATTMSNIFMYLIEDIIIDTSIDKVEIEFMVDVDSQTEESDMISYQDMFELKNMICEDILDIKIEDVWNNPKKYQDLPMFGFINSADSDCVIGPKWSGKLAKELSEMIDDMKIHIQNNSKYSDSKIRHLGASLDFLLEAFTCSSKSGIIIIK
jgi:hypothetical protein